MESKESALQALLTLATGKGYLTINDMIDFAEQFFLPISAVDWLSSRISMNGILIYDEEPELTPLENIAKENEETAHSNYDVVYEEALSLCPSMEMIIHYVKEIKPPQTREFSQLKYQVVEGNLYARKRLVEMYLRLALKIALDRAKQYDWDLEDTFSLACIGLINATDHYNPDKNGQFAAYSSRYILQSIYREQPTLNTAIYFPVHRKDNFISFYPKVKREECHLCQQISGCPLLLTEAKTQFCCDEIQAKELLVACAECQSVEQLMEEYEQFCEENPFHEIDTQLTQRFDEISQEKTVLLHLKQQVEKIFLALKEKERDVLELRFGIKDGNERTLEETGAVFGITRERVRQIEKKALARLNYSARRKILKDFWVEL